MNQTPQRLVRPFAIGLVLAAWPGVVAAQSLTLEDTVSRALQNASKVKQASHDLESQVERRKGAWADVGPRLSLDYNQVYFKDAQTMQFGGNEVTLRPEVTKTGSLTAVQPITGAFALARRARFEGAQEDLKEIGLKLAQSDTAFQAAETFLRTQAAAKQVEIARTSVAAAEKQLSDASAMERVGRMNRGDVLKLELAVSEAKARAAQARAGYEIALAALREAIALPGADAIQLDPTILAAHELPVQNVDQAVKEAMPRRLDDDQAEAGVVAGEFQKAVAYSGFSPSVNAFVKHERNFGEVSGLGGQKDTRTYGVQVNWVLWENGSKVFAVREASEQIAKAEEMKRGYEQMIRLDMAQILANLAASRESLALAGSSVAQAEEAYRIENARFQTGSRSATDLILAETSRSGAQGRLVTARTDLAVWAMKLQKAMGYERPVLAPAQGSGK